ncbi:MAG: cation:proton antiporter [Cyanobacteria bacterium P01_G01_bin.39]
MSAYSIGMIAIAILPLTDPVYIVFVLLLLIAIAPLISRFLRIPSLVALILLGTIFGDNVLGILVRDNRLILLEKFGLLYIMLLAGIQMDISNFKRFGLRSLVFGLLTFIIPLSVGFISGQLMAYSLIASVLLGVLYSPHTLVSYPIVARLGITQKEVVAVAVGGTVVTSILTLASFSVIQAIVNDSIGFFLWIKLFVLLPIFGLSYWLLVAKLGNLILKKTEDFLIPQYIFVLTSLFVAATATQLLGVDAIVGAFIAGLALNSLISLDSPLMNRIEFVGNSLFIPIFLISVGVLCNPQILLAHPEILGIASFIIIGAMGSKFLAAAIAGRAFSFSVTEIMTTFSLTTSRAGLVLVIALFGKSKEFFNEEIFNIIVLYIIVTCLLGPLIVELFAQKLANKLSITHPN